MMSIEMKRVLKIAEDLDEKVTCYDFQSNVFIIHEEGTILNFRSAFLMKYFDTEHGDWGASEHPGEWLLVLTEHHGVHVYPIDDLTYWEQSVPVEIKEHKIGVN